MKDAAYWIQKLSLEDHPEGGYYRETHKSSEFIAANHLPARYPGARAFGTSIYFLLRDVDVAKFHRLSSDEVWYYHAGGTARIHMISQEGEYFFKDVGPQVEKNQSFQVTVPNNHWYAIEILTGPYILVGCMVAPGFEYEDFKLANYETLVNQFPKLTSLIKKFTPCQGEENFTHKIKDSTIYQQNGHNISRH